MANDWKGFAERLRSDPGKWVIVLEGEGVDRCKAVERQLRKYGLGVTRKRGDDGYTVYARAV